MNEFLDRTDPAYLEQALDGAFDSGTDVVWGVKAGNAPQTFEDLQTIVDAARNAECGVSDEIDHFMDLIANDPDRDGVAQRLPFVDGFLSFILLSNS